MEGARNRTVDAIRSILERAGFFVTDTHSVRPTSFDLMARRDSTLLIVKVLKNIDALDADEAGRLGELSRLFGARVLVVGHASGASELEAGVVYYRHGLPILSEESLEEYLLEGVPPFLFSSPGGVFVRIAGDRLRELREARGLSLGALASIAGVSRRTIQLYEGGAGAEMQIVERLEQYLREPIAHAIDLLQSVAEELEPADPAEGPARGAGRREPAPEDESRRARRPTRTGDPLRDTVFRQLDGMGWEVVVTIRCPFDAFTQGSAAGLREFLLTGVGSLRSAQHRAEVLSGLARVAEGHALFVVDEAPHRTAVDGLPLVTAHELGRRRDPDELLELIEEREGS